MPITSAGDPRHWGSYGIGRKIRQMRTLAPLFLLTLPILMYAQQPAGRGATPPQSFKNLKLIDEKTDVMLVMRDFNKALGVQCTYCHVQGDFPADTNPKKDIARKMIAMVRVIDTSFPSSTGNYPQGYHEVDCITCHRGSAKPETVAPKKFYTRVFPHGMPSASEPKPGVSLKVLPLDTHVHGTDTVMGEFNDALHVDCNYCHGGGRSQEFDINPRKDIARKMILLTRQINANFPGTGVFPVGQQEVTCYTCHRGDPHPPSVSNSPAEE